MTVAEAQPLDNATNRPIRVVIVDDHLVVRAGLRRLLAPHPLIGVVGEARDFAGAMRAVERFRPDVVLLEVSLGTQSGLAACPEIVRRSP